MSTIWKHISRSDSQIGRRIFSRFSLSAFGTAAKPTAVASLTFCFQSEASVLLQIVLARPSASESRGAPLHRVRPALSVAYKRTMQSITIPRSHHVSDREEYRQIAWILPREAGDPPAAHQVARNVPPIV